MKRKLLSLAAALLCAVGSWAQTPGDDMTSRITNPTFTDNANGWDITDNARYYDGKGFDGTTNFIEFTKWDSSWDATISQTITSLPNGYYKVQAAGQMSGTTDTWMKLVANGIENQFSRNNAADGNILANGTETTIGSGVAGWRYTRVIAKVTDGTLAISCVGHSDVKERWANVDAFTLTYLGTILPDDTDLTPYIVNHSFETRDLTGWTTSGTSSDTQVCTPDGSHATTGADGNYIFNTWWQGVALTQAITSLPNGLYTLKASLASSDANKDGKLFLLAGGNHSDVITITQGTSGQFNDYTYNFSVNDGSTTIGVVGGNDDGTYNANGHWWYKADNFRLIYRGARLSDAAGTLPNGSAVTSNTWYKISLASDADYFVHSSAAATISYTTDGSQACSSATGTNATFSAGETKVISFAEGTLYIKADAATTIVIVAKENGANVTDVFITNPSFETGTTTGWTYEESNDHGARDNSNETYKMSNVDGDYLFNIWESGNTISQTLKDLPAGIYKLTAVMGTDAGATFRLKMGDNTGNAASVDKGTGVTVTVYSTLADKGDLTISADAGGSQWYKVDNFRLTYLEPATDADYTALNAAITSAEDHTLGFDNGEYAPYNNVDALEALAAAEAINQSVANPITDVQTATTVLTEASWTPNATEENAFFDGDFSECAEDNTSPLDYTPAGWTASNNMRMMLKNSETYPGLTDASATSAMMSWTAGINYGETTGYTMPLNAYTIYELKFKAAGWNNESRSGMTVSVLNSSDGLAATDLGTPDRDIKGNEINTAGMTSYTKRFKTGAAGNYVFHIQSGHNFVLTDLELKKAATTTIDTDENYTPEAGLANVEMTRTIKVGYNTVCLPFDVTADQVTAAFGADSEVYTYSENSASEESIDLTFTKNVAGTISANEPVLVKATAASTTQTFNGVEIVAPVGGTKVTGKYFDYVGVYSLTELAAGDYFLATKDGVQQIFKSIGGDKVKPFRAYFKVNEDPDETGGDVKLFIDDEATGIDSLTPDPSPVGEGSIYNLAGQRMSKMQKGINIVNGKKILY